MKSKYIVIKRICEEAIIFSDLFNHSEIFCMLGIGRDKLVSAGFVSLGTDPLTLQVKVSAYGKATSLKVESRPEDDVVLAKTLGIYEPDF